MRQTDRPTRRANGEAKHTFLIYQPHHLKKLIMQNKSSQAPASPLRCGGIILRGSPPPGDALSNVMKAFSVLRVEGNSGQKESDSPRSSTPSKQPANALSRGGEFLNGTPGVANRTDATECDQGVPQTDIKGKREVQGIFFPLLNFQSRAKTIDFQEFHAEALSETL